MLILGLDPGTKTGWALCRKGKIVESGVQEFALFRGESPGMRFLRFRKWLYRICCPEPGFSKGARLFAISLVSYEQAHHRGGYATQLGVGLTTRIQEVTADLGIECLPIHSGTLKKWATGSGKSEKREMMKAAGQRVGGGPILDDNQADAILIALWAWEQTSCSESGEERTAFPEKPPVQPREGKTESQRHSR